MHPLHNIRLHCTAADRISAGFILFTVKDQQGLYIINDMGLKSIPYVLHAPPSSSYLVLSL